MEFFQGFLGTLALVIAALYSLLAWLGGRDVQFLGIKNRLWGRVFAPTFFSLAVCGLAALAHSFSWWMLFSVPAYLFSHRMGYGGDKFIVKASRRSLWSLVRVSAGLTFAAFTGQWLLWSLQLFIGLPAAVVLGTQNTTPAPIEEGLINFSNAFVIPFCVLAFGA